MTSLLLLLAVRPALAGSITASAGGPYTGAAYSSVTLSASGTTSSGNCTTAGLLYQWDTNGDGSYDTSDSSSSSTTFSASGYDGPTSVTPTVRVTNSGCSNVATASSTTILTNVAPVISSTSIATTASEGVAQTMSVSYTDVETADTQSVAWSFSDGTSASGASTSKRFADNGSYTATVTVTDDDGGTVSSGSSITVTNVAPVISSPSGTSSRAEGATFTRSCVEADVAADTISWAWNWGDGTTASGGTSATSSATHAYVDEGTGSYTVTCTATDDDGGSSSSATSVTVANATPVATASGSATAIEGAAVTYSCSGTDAGTADTLSYAWTFSDGTSGSGASVSHTWADQGISSAVCTVTDNDGASSTSTVSTTVSNTAPAISSVAGTTSGNEGGTYSYTCTATDIAADTISYSWTFGDGGTGSGASVSRVFVDEGNYTVACTAADEDGGSSRSTTTATVANVAPVISAVTIPSGADEGTSLTFSATATDVGTSDTLAYAWSFGDGSTASGPTATHTYGDNGAYTVTLRVTDGDGGTATHSASTVIANVSPVISSFTGDATGTEGDTFAYDVVYTDVGSSDTTTVSWDYGDGVTDGDLDSVSHVYENEGTYTVSVSVCDDDGVCDTATMDVVVSNGAPVIVSLVGDTVGNEGDSYSFTCAAADPGPVDVLSYTWNFGDGSSSTGANATHTYTDDSV